MRTIFKSEVLEILYPKLANKVIKQDSKKDTE